MVQTYSDPKRASDPYALPDVEVFEVTDQEVRELRARHLFDEEPSPDDAMFDEPGWYWWVCFPGCLPSGDPHGPFQSAREAEKDAQAEASEGGF